MAHVVGGAGWWCVGRLFISVLAIMLMSSRMAATHVGGAHGDGHVVGQHDDEHADVVYVVVVRACMHVCMSVCARASFCKRGPEFQVPGSKTPLPR